MVFYKFIKILEYEIANVSQIHLDKRSIVNIFSSRDKMLPESRRRSDKQKRYDLVPSTRKEFKGSAMIRYAERVNA